VLILLAICPCLPSQENLTLFRRRWFKEVVTPLPMEHLTNVDHLFDHLSVSVYGIPCGSTDLPKSGNQLSTGGSWGFLGDYGHLRNLTTNQKVANTSQLRAVITITLTITRRGLAGVYGG
jgi:hypothetical protein